MKLLVDQQSKQPDNIARQFLKYSFGLGFSEVVLQMILVLQAKFLAVTVGTKGVGTYAMLNSFFALIGAIVFGAIALTGTQFISRARSKGDDSVIRYISTLTASAGLVLSLVTSVILFFSRSSIEHTALQNSVPFIFITLFAVAFPFQFLRQIGLALLQGLQRFRDAIKLRLVVSTIQVTMVVVLTLRFGVNGFISAMAISVVIAGIIYAYTLRDVFDLKVLRDTSLAKLMIGPLISFAGMDFLLGVIGNGKDFIQRAIVLNRMDISSVGLFTAGMQIAIVLAIADRGTGFYFLPKMSEVQTSENRSHAIHIYILYATAIGVAIFLPVALFGKVLIRLLFSQEFLPLSDALGFFVLAQFVGICASPPGLALIGLRKMKIHAVASTLSLSLMIAVPFFFLDRVGLLALPLGIALGYSIGGIIRFWFLWKNEFASFDLRLIVPIIAVSFFILLAHTLRDSNIIVRAIFLGTIWVGMLIIALKSPKIRRSMWSYGQQAYDYVKTYLQGIRV